MNISKYPLTVLLICFSLVAGQAEAALIGRASVIDGDTLEIQGQHIRLYGVDAPESTQLCQKEGKDYRCGQQAALALNGAIDGRTVRCEQKDTDQYKRAVADCFAGSVNLNAWMATQGWALAYREYTSVYVQYEDEAKAKREGMWQGTFVAPWEYRRAQRNAKSKSTIAPDFKCVIKGNISAMGARIYHLPGSKWYQKTSINIKKGERWFCSEDEARSAGWRSAQP